MRDQGEPRSRLIGSIGPGTPHASCSSSSSGGRSQALGCRTISGSAPWTPTSTTDGRRALLSRRWSPIRPSGGPAEQACVDDSLTWQRNGFLRTRISAVKPPGVPVHANGTTGPGRQNTGRPRSGPRPREALDARPSRNQRSHFLLVTRRARVSCGVCSEPDIGCVRRTAVRTRSEHLPNIWRIRRLRRIHICPGNRAFCETLPDARAPSHGGNPGSNPGSGTSFLPANKHF